MTAAEATGGAATVPTTRDAFLGDRLTILQPATGYRAGVDAVLLAAAVPEPQGAFDVLDCGAGVGTVGLCIASRCRDARVTLVEREPALIDLARHNIQNNGFADRVSIVPGDVTAPASSPAAPQLPPESFDHILANPPYHDAGGGTNAHDSLKRASHAMHPAALEDWIRFAARLARPGGRLTLIHKADALPALCEALSGRFGALAITPVHPYADQSAIRVIVSGLKGSRAPLVLRPPLVLHEPGGGFAPYVGQILRHGAPLIPARPA